MKTPLLRTALCCLLCFSLLLCAPGAGAQAPRGVFYEVYVRAFADSNGDGVGDLRGLTQKLDYLNDGNPSTFDDLGVSGLWLMPVFDAHSDHGYDTVDYYRIDPDYGSNDDMRALLEAAHERGIAVIVDLVVNHTSSAHPWFQNALDGGDKRDWYRFFDAATDDPALLSSAPLGGPAWHDSRGGSYCALFWEGMPDLNLSNPAVTAEIEAIARFWLEMGVDGFRLDATSHFFGYGEEGLSQDTARSGEWLRGFSDSLRAEYPDVYLVGEAWENQQKRADILRGVDSVFNFDVGERLIALITQGGDANLFPRDLQAYQAACREANPAFWDAPFLTNHDQDRVLGQLKYNEQYYRLLCGVLLTLPGNPYLYYGEEIGMRGAKPDEELRTPLLWGGNDPAQCSFFPGRYNKKTVPVADQAADPDSLLGAVIGLIAVRNRSDALRLGELTALQTGNKWLMAYEMRFGDEIVRVFHNFHDTEAQPLTLSFDRVAPDSPVLYGTLTDGAIPPLSTLIVRCEGGN